MTDESIEVAVIIVAYNSRDDLAECLADKDRWADKSVRVRVVVVDCGSEDGSAEYVREMFPEVDVIEPGENLGFAGGNNVGWDFIRERYPRVRYVALLNPDTDPDRGWLDPLIERLEAEPGTGTCQPMITLYDEPGLVNTAGNRSHYLGFGLVSLCGQPIPYEKKPWRIGYSSGAAMMVRASLLSEHGLFEPEMFLYCEDTDLGWKLSQQGLKHELVPSSRVSHKFDASGAIQRHYYFLERNRWWLLLVYYKWKTLVLILPAILLMEAGQVLYSFLIGKFTDKWRAWKYFFNPACRQRVLARRRIAQQKRKIKDREFAKQMIGMIEHPSLGGAVLKYVANPVLGAYWWCVKWVIFW